MNILESIFLALDSVKVNKLRAGLALLSVAIGVFAIMLFGSLINSINSTVDTQMDQLGDNMFHIYRMPKIQFGNRSWWKYRKRKAITLSQYKEFKSRILPYVKDICATSTTSGIQVGYDKNQTNPDFTMVGADGGYFTTVSLNVVQGRPIVDDDIFFNRDVVVIGNDAVVQLFPNSNPIGKRIKIKNHMFEVIGVLEIKGAILGQSQDKQVIIPINKFLNYYSSEWEESLTISVKTFDKASLTPTMDEGIGIMRNIRKVKPWEENSFESETNESLEDQFKGLTDFLSWFGLISGIIAIIAAGVGIMNIMLVSVKERTREIGIRKAVGAKRRWILWQFIVEAITLCIIGGFAGIISGMGVAALFGKLMGLTFGFPVAWVIASMLICIFLGVVSGVYPAYRAAKLDPIDALRYE